MRLSRLALFLAALSGLGACHKSTSVDQTNGSGGSGATASTARPLATCSSATTPGSHGPTMVHVGRLDGSCIWVDESEVTVADYADFLATTPTPMEVDACAGQHPGGFAPHGANDAGAPADPDGAHPVRSVDWCDAAAYCVWAGKRLCGEYDDAPRPTRSELQDVCENGFDTGFDFNAFTSSQTSACNGGMATGAVADVKAFTECVTPTSVFDLVGNVHEWTSEGCASKPFSTACKARGGGYDSQGDAWGCEKTVPLPRTMTRDDLGLRCCAD